MPSIEQNDFTMHYEITGGGPESILLIHGNIASTRWWDAYLNYLPQGCRAIAMDLRGCGRSGHPKTGYTINQFADDIHVLTEHLALKKFHLIGHSMGGQIALCYSLRHPEQVQTLTLLASVPAAGIDLDDTIRAGFGILMTDKNALRQTVDSCMQYSSDKTFAEQFCEDALGCASNVFKDNLETMHETVMLDQVGSIKAPALLIHGREDLAVPLASIESTIQAMPAAEVVIFDECSHSPQIEKTQKFSEVFNNFIKKYPINNRRR